MAHWMSREESMIEATDPAPFGEASALPERIEASSRQITLPWHYVSLGAILLLAAFLNFYELAKEGYANSFYAAAVKSMSLNWHNFFFNSFDPGGFVTIDKPPLGFWFQVASVKLFGYSGVSILLPEGLAGILSVALLYHLVQRVFGRTAGLLSALILAVTPVAVADNRNNTIDSILVLFMLLGAWAVSRAVEARRAGERRGSGFRWLLLCAVLVGLGFNVKMLEAYLVVPAFGLVYLLGAQARWQARIIHLVLAAVVMLAVSLSWAVAVDLTPASQRPWVDSTTTNSEIDLAIGYNGLERLLGQGGGGALGGGGQRNATRGNTQSAAAGTSQGSTGSGTAQSTTSGTAQGATGTSGSTGNGNGQSATSGTLPGSTGAPLSLSGTALGATGNGGGGGPGGGGGGGLFNNGSVGPFRLLDTQLGGQVGWLIPLAVIALLAAFSRRVRFPLDQKQKAFILWGMWLITTVGFFSLAGFFHSYYLVTVAPAAASLAGIGLVTLWQDYLQFTRLTNLRGWVLPAALLITALAQVHILQDYPSWSMWLTPLVLSLTVIGVVVLAGARFRRGRKLRLWTPLAAAIGMTALLITPTVWAAETIGNSNTGIPSAGPTAQGGNGGPGGFGGGRSASGRLQFGEALSGANSNQQSLGTGTGQSATGGGFAQGAAGGQPPTGGGFGGPNGAAGFAGAGGGRGFGGGGGSDVDTQLLAYLEKHQGTTKYLFATSSSNSAAPYIIQSGKAVMALGGFTGSDPILTLAQFQALVKNNTVHYVMAGGQGGGGGQSGGDSIMTWVQSSCTAVPSTAWQTTTTTTGNSQEFGGTSDLYYCSGS